LGIRTEGTSGPLTWQAKDLNVVTKTIEGQEREDYTFTLVIKNVSSSALTLTSMERTVYQAGGGQAGTSQLNGVWEVKPGGSWTFPLFSYQYCGTTSCTFRGMSAPMWKIVFKGRDVSNRDVVIPLEMALPAVATTKEFYTAGPSRPAATPVTAASGSQPPPTPAAERPAVARAPAASSTVTPGASGPQPLHTPSREAPAVTRAPSVSRTPLGDQQTTEAGGPMIPIQVVENVVLVPATLNGTHGATLLLDTGAQYTIVTPALAARLSLTAPPNALTRSVSVVGGQKISVPFVRLPVLAIGSTTIINLEVGIYAVAPDSPIVDGLLGADVLSQYRVIVDHSMRQLRLEPAR
jgi:hypothetical protein